MKISLPFLHKKNTTGSRSEPGYVRYINLVGNDAFADWSLILLTTCILSIILICIGSYVYVDTKIVLNSQGTAPASDMSTVHFDQKKLEQVISAFDARAGERVLLGKGYTGPSDPSLP